MAEYKYQGKTFQVEENSDCKWEVTDGVNTAYIGLHPSINSEAQTLYQVEIKNTRGGQSTPQAAIDTACVLLIKYRDRVSPEDACKAMSEYVRNLDPLKQ